MKINIVAPVNGTSYGLTVCYWLFHLYRENVSLFPIGRPDPPYPIFQTPVANALKHSQEFDKNAICLRKFHPNDMALRIGNPTVGYTVFELETLRKNEKHHLNSLDALISPTAWQIDVLKQNGISIPLYKVPLGVDKSIFMPLEIDIPNKPFQFIALGKWENRKNYDQMLRCFDKAFSPSDDVELHLLTFTFFEQARERANRDLNALLNNIRIGYKVKVYPQQFIPPQQLAQIYNMCDCGITLSHAEGFNLPLLEMLACGLPVIATNVTGHTEYLKQEHGILIDSIGKEQCFDEIFFPDKFGEWYTFADEQIIEAMRYAFNNFKKSNFKDNAKISDIYNWEESSKKLLTTLKELKGD